MNKNWQTVFSGKIFNLMQNEKGWEKAVRAPGVRIILDDQERQKVLLTKEFRQELNDYDWRLPGGKVFDSLTAYQQFLDQELDIIEPAKIKVAQEALEETGYQVDEAEFITKSTLGATVEWDLYYFSINNFVKNESGQKLETGEVIETDNWFDYDEVKQMILNGKMSEQRSALILLQYLNNKQ